MLIYAPLLLGDGPSAQLTENSMVQIAVATPPSSVTNFGTGFFIRDDGLIATASHVYLKALNAIVDARAIRAPDSRHATGASEPPPLWIFQRCYDPRQRCDLAVRLYDYQSSDSFQA